VLCFQPDPAALLRKISRLVRPGGIVLFHEPDRKQMRSYPPTPTYDKMSEWIGETFARTGMDVRMGIKLYSRFLAAGLAGPAMGLPAVIGGAKRWRRSILNPMRRSRLPRPWSERALQRRMNSALIRLSSA